MENLKKNSIQEAMVIHAAAIVEYAKRNEVSLDELMAFISTPEGMEKMIAFSSRVYIAGKQSKVF